MGAETPSLRISEKRSRLPHRLISLYYSSGRNVRRPRATASGTEVPRTTVRRSGLREKGKAEALLLIILLYSLHNCVWLSGIIDWVFQNKLGGKAQVTSCEVGRCGGRDRRDDLIWLAHTTVLVATHMMYSWHSFQLNQTSQIL